MILICIAAFVLLGSYLSYRMAFYVAPKQRGKGIPLPGGEQYARVKDRTDALFSEMSALEFEEVSIVAEDGTHLFGRYHHTADGAPVQIQFHGYRGSWIRDFCGGNKLARACGHNTLVIDQRAHGKSGGRTITFGIRERHDCLCWATYAHERFGNVPVFLSGVSMGAATVLMASELDLPDNVCGIIADSPYDTPEGIIRKVCRDMKLPENIAFLFVRLGARIFGGFDIRAAGSAAAAAKSKVPVLVIHGEDDRFVPCEMSAAIRDANSAMVTRETFPDAGHGLSYVTDTERYGRIVRAFIEKCLAEKVSKA